MDDGPVIHRIGELDRLQPGINLCVLERPASRGGWHAWVGIYLVDAAGSVEALRVQGRPGDYEVTHTWWQGEGREQSCDRTHDVAHARDAHEMARGYWWPYSDLWEAAG